MSASYEYLTQLVEVFTDGEGLRWIPPEEGFRLVFVTRVFDASYPCGTTLALTWEREAY